MAEALNPALLAERTQAFGAFVEAVMTAPPRGLMFVAGSLKPRWVSAATDIEIPPATADITVRDSDILHTFRDGKTNKLDLDWYKRLPEHLDAPEAVILDTAQADHPAFLLIFGRQDNRADKLVVRINYRIKKGGLGNIVQTGKHVDLDSVRGMLENGAILVEGSL